MILVGWLFSIALFVVSCATGNESIMIAAGLFAIAGAIGLKDFKGGSK